MVTCCRLQHGVCHSCGMSHASTWLCIYAVGFCCVAQRVTGICSTVSRRVDVCVALCVPTYTDALAGKDSIMMLHVLPRAVCRAV